MKFTAALVIASAIGVYCQANTGAVSSVASVSRVPAATSTSRITARTTGRPTTSVGTISRPTTRRTNTTVIAAGPNPVAPGVGLAALMALGALI
ncbi:hypothetical protein J3458_011601 [Metarhizium acridum]|uniref:Uncharacterized protein n=1 Tax=Metarhizium acridum (strain CQMa 102) TaxID=655827 RepID=E9E7U8_METAQ|nr:uncharacterized protein MAC_05946 [Metarhizium acridum CQMa 102]EFY87955.1 hypothetical protein MAC_05946 [Metarhizium acridum CQMa 102]KAG8407224.1 hypothetical protein J3458_020714 [Metarhizium acridum]KAG8413944.1 hypothetical protein J3458_011601 [Metarhizium acridum]